MCIALVTRSIRLAPPGLSSVFTFAFSHSATYFAFSSVLRASFSSTIALSGTPRSRRRGYDASASPSPEVITTGALPAFQRRAACHTLSAPRCISAYTSVFVFALIPPPSTTIASALGMSSARCGGYICSSDFLKSGLVKPNPQNVNHTSAAVANHNPVRRHLRQPNTTAAKRSSSPTDIGFINPKTILFR